MADAKHTPNRWLAPDRVVGEGFAIVVEQYMTGRVVAVCDPGKGKSQFRISGEEALANARLIAAAPVFMTAAGGDLDPREQRDCGPLAWLHSAIDALSNPKVRAIEEGDDPSAYDEMLAELRRLHDGLQGAIATAEGR